MTTVFISYSRKDGAFVHRLHEALGCHDHQTWVDWEGIPPTAEWMTEVLAAIDSASAFVFIITPDSLASTVCARELMHASSQNKRLIPVLNRDINGTTAPECVAKLNWIFFRDSDDFTSSLQTLITAIDTDLDWVHAHSRMLVRAREWDAKRRENSLVLRGNDLKTAERWLTLGPTKQPKPTELQTLYILQSRKVATNRRYRLLGAVMISLVAVVILATTTYLGRREASRQQRIALVGRLTADADLAREQSETLPKTMGWFEKSALLATEATNQLDSLGIRSLQTDMAMRRGLAVLPKRFAQFERSSVATVDAIAFGEAGRLIAASKGPFGVEQWNIKTKEPINSKQPRGSVVSVLFSPDGKFLATTELNNVPGVIDIWEAASLEPVASFPDHGDEVEAFAISPAATYLAVSTNEFDKRTGAPLPGPTRIWAVKNTPRREIARLPHATTLAFSSEGSWLAGVVDSIPRVWKMSNGPPADGSNAIEAAPKPKEIHLTVPQSETLSLQFNSNGTQLVASFENSRVLIWAVSDWHVTHDFKSDGTPWAISSDCKYIAVKNDNYTARVLDTAEGNEVARLHSTDAIDTVSFRPDAQELVVAGLSKKVDLWRIDEGVNDSKRISVGANVVGSTFNHAQTTFSTLTRLGDKLVAKNWSLNEGLERSSRGIDISGDLTTFSSNGSFFAATSGQAIAIVNAENGKTIRKMIFQGRPTAIALSPDGSSLAIATDSDVILLWDGGANQSGPNKEPRQFAVQGKVSQHNLAVGSFGMAAVVTERITRAGESMVTYFWRSPGVLPATKSPLGNNRSGLTATPCALSADGLYLVTNQSNGLMAIRDTRTGLTIATVDHPGGDNACALSADSSLLATSGSGIVRVWDSRAQVEIARIERAPDVGALTFSPHGRYLATVGLQNGATRIWLLQPTDLIEAACARLTQNMSREEWREYFGDKPYRATCQALASAESESSHSKTP